MLVDLPNHGGQKGRLRTGEEVGSVCVEDRAVVFDLEEEVFDHAAGEFGALVRDEAKKDEVAVPAIHLVEAAAGNHVPVGKIEETLNRDLRDADIAHVGDPARKVLHGYMTLLLRCGNRSGGWHTGREVEYRVCRHLNVDQRFAVGHGAGERIPAAIDVALDLRVRRCVLLASLSACGCSGQQAENEQDGTCADDVFHRPSGPDFDRQPTTNSVTHYWFVQQRSSNCVRCLYGCAWPPRWVANVHS